ncbi:MAG TPA: hypothetical protein VID26_03475 [Candidatus Limnocylindrales bacterium]
MPESICIIRHAEKQLADAPPRAVAVDGSPDPESLIVAGWQRAGALISLFVPRPGGTAPLPTPTRLIASEVGPHSHSRRPIETLEPLAARLGLALDDPFVQDDLDQLVATLKASSGHILVAWEHKRIPLIANELVGSPGAVPQVWPDDRFDLVWVFEPGANGATYGFRQVPELLLAGDRAEPIA